MVDTSMVPRIAESLSIGGTSDGGGVMCSGYVNALSSASSLPPPPPIHDILSDSNSHHPGMISHIKFMEYLTCYLPFVPAERGRIERTTEMKGIDEQCAGNTRFGLRYYSARFAMLHAPPHPR